jgi:predicted RNA binding protein YcfA (HicA-like mRNA interferase family)
VTRLPTLTATKVIRALQHGGFVLVNQKGSHAHFYHAVRNVLTTVPVHPGDLPRALVSTIIRQAGLSTEGFRRLL